MTQVTKKTSTPLYDYGGVLLLLIIQIPCIFFLFISFYSEDKFIFLYLIPLYCFIYCSLRASVIGIKYFISVEECFYEDKKFHYRKTLFSRWTIREFFVPILEIERIEDRGKKVFKKASNMWNVFYYIYYFKIHERICLHMKNGEKYYIWNFVKSPSLTCVYDNSADSDEEFLECFQELQRMFEEGKSEASFQNRLKEWEEIYEKPKTEKYRCILTQILKEEKVFFRKEKDVFSVNAGEEAILHLDMFKKMEFEEMDFYKFYLDYLSNKDYENTVVRVGDNGRDYQEVTMKQLKEDINKLRDEK